MSSDLSVKYLIIGSGPCGLGAGYYFTENGESDFLIVEKENYPGGLATSFTDTKGFTWDIGGHVQFSHYDYFDKVMIRALGENGWLYHLRSSWVWLKDRFIPYPFQNNIHRLPKREMLECLEGLEGRDPKAKPSNFKEWLNASFGNGICEHFLYPYNFKVWAYPPEQLNYKWIGERVSTVDVERIKNNIKYSRDDVAWGPNSKFKFPRVGGTGSIWKKVAEHIPKEKFLFNSSLEKLEIGARTATLSTGQTIKFEKILSTIPLDLLCKISVDIKAKLMESASNLKHSSTHVVGLGIRGKTPEHLNDKCWMYFPEEDSPFYRVTVFSNYSPNNVPDNDQYFSLMTETSESHQKPVDSSSIIEETIQGAINSNLITSKDEIVSKWHIRMEYGYPTPSSDRDDILREVIPYLDENMIYSRGRFGGWKYEVSNQDHSFMQGVEWSRMVLGKRPEETFKV